MEELIIKAQSGDRIAMNNLIKKIYPLIRKVINDDDTVNKVAIKVFRKLGNFNPEKGDFSSWVSVISKNEKWKAYNKKVSSKEFVLMFDEDGHVFHSNSVFYSKEIELNSINGLFKKSLEESIESLSEPQKQVFILHEIEGYDHVEIAKIKGISENTSKSNLLRAKNNLRKELSKRINYERTISHLQSSVVS